MSPAFSANRFGGAAKKGQSKQNEAVDLRTIDPEMKEKSNLNNLTKTGYLIGKNADICRNELALELKFRTKSDNKFLRKNVDAIKRILIQNTIRNYAIGKYNQFLRRHTINDYLENLQNKFIYYGQNIQHRVEKNLLDMKKCANNMLFPLEFQLFYNKKFDARKALDMPLSERNEYCKNAILYTKNNFSNLANQVFLYESKEISKDLLSKFYSQIQSNIVEINECRKMMKSEFFLRNLENVSKIPYKSNAIMRRIFEVSDTKIHLSTLQLLDLKELCKICGMNDLIKIVNKMIYEINQ